MTPTDGPSLHIVLYQPEIPYNTGSVGRTCVALGAKLWLVKPLGFRVDDYHLRRAGLDYWQYLAWETVDDWQQLTERLPVAQHWYFSKKASRSYIDCRFLQHEVLVFGPESLGLPDSILEADPDRVVRIPTRSEVRSLNLSNCVAIAAYEVHRQWQTV